MKKIIARLRQFLLVNTSSKQTVIKNTFWLILAEWVSKWSVAIITILIWRLFGTEVFGIYSYRWVILAFLLIFADLGLTTLLIRDYQHLASHERSHYLSQWLKTKWLLSGLVIVIFWFILFLSTDDLMIRQVGVMLLLYGLTNSFLEYLRGSFRSLQRSQVEFQIKLIQGIGNLCIIPLVFLVSSIVPIIGAQAFICMLTICYAWYMIQKKQVLAIDDNTQTYWIRKIELIKKGWMYSMSILFVSMYYYVDSLIIKYYWGYEKVGIYNAAYKIIILSIMPIIFLWNAIFPVLKSAFDEWKEKFHEITMYYTKLTWFSWVIIYWILILLAWFILNYTFGSDYSKEWTIVLQMLFITWIINYIYSNISRAVSTIKPKHHLYSVAWAFVFNIVSNMMIVPRYWMIWAAATTIMTEIFVMSLLIYFYIKIIQT